MGQKLCKFIYTKVLGWGYVEGHDHMPPVDKSLMLFAPHTSFMDFVYGYFFIHSIGGDARIMIKKEAFFWPLGPVLKALGGFPIDRKNPTSLLMSVIHSMSQVDRGHVILCPEGTRKAVRKWKTGYHSIAKQAGLPLFLSYADYKKKVCGIVPAEVYLGDSPRQDTDRIQEMYAGMNLNALHPEGYVTK